jgi:hypothetical protein
VSLDAHVRRAAHALDLVRVLDESQRGERPGEVLESDVGDLGELAEDRVAQCLGGALEIEAAAPRG